MREWVNEPIDYERLLDDLGGDKPRLVVANQIDRCPAEAIQAITELEPDAIFISATDGTGLQRLKRRLELEFWDPPGSLDMTPGTDTDTVSQLSPTDHASPWPN